MCKAHVQSKLVVLQEQQGDQCGRARESLREEIAGDKGREVGGVGSWTASVPFEDPRLILPEMRSHRDAEQGLT